jgi:hypothetical protein
MRREGSRYITGVSDALAFSTGAFINTLVDDTDRRHELAHFINKQANFFDRYNQIALELFNLSMMPVEESHVAVTEVYALLKLFDMENYLLLPPVVEGKKNNPRTKERGDSKTQLARNLYFLGITHKRVLEHGIEEEVQQTRVHARGGIGTKCMMYHLTCLTIFLMSLRRGS